MHGPLETIPRCRLSTADSAGKSEALTAPEGQLAEHYRCQLLKLAQDLDRYGRRTERFLSLQLQQLQLAISDFEQEKAAWHRQQTREAKALERQGRELQKAQIRGQIQSPPISGTSPPQTEGPTVPEESQQLRFQPVDVPREVISSSNAPLRILLAPGKSSSLQIGLLMFEMARFNRELGGIGVRFEVTDCREPKRSLIGRRDPVDDEVIVALEAFSRRPLTATNTRGRVEVNEDADLRIWHVFKSQLLMSSLVNVELHHAFRRSRRSVREHQLRAMVLDAARRSDDANHNCYDERRPMGAVLRAYSSIDSVRQQLHRLERCVATLSEDRGVKLHVSLV